MQEPQILVSSGLIKRLRIMLIQMALNENNPPSVQRQAIEPHRQYCEGYLGIKREKLTAMNPAEVAEVLDVTGLGSAD